MKKIIVLSIMSALLFGCANSDVYSGDVYSADQAKYVQSVSYGTIVSVRAVKIQTNSRDRNVIGTVGGAILGGFLGNTIGGGTGNRLATAGGVVGGALVGNAIEDKSSQTNAVELEIRQENGRNIVVVQKGSPSQFYSGQAVRLVNDGRRVNVSPR